MITNWKVIGAAVLGLAAAGVWIPRFLGGSGSGVDPASEPPPEYWESGATEAWERPSANSTESSGESPSSKAPSVEVASATAPSVSTAVASAERGQTPAPTQLDPADLGSDLETDRLLSVARALRGDGFEAAAVTQVRANEPSLPVSIPEPSPVPGQIDDLTGTQVLTATLIGEDSTMALVNGRLLGAGDQLGDSGAVIVEVRKRRVLCSLRGTEFELEIPAFRTRAPAAPFSGASQGAELDPEL